MILTRLSMQVGQAFHRDPIFSGEYGSSPALMGYDLWLYDSSRERRVGPLVVWRAPDAGGEAAAFQKLGELMLVFSGPCR